MYQGFRVATTTGDQNYIKGNSKYFAFPAGGGGGPICIQKHHNPGRMPSQLPVLAGHKYGIVSLCDSQGRCLRFRFQPLQRRADHQLFRRLDCDGRILRSPSPVALAVPRGRSDGDDYAAHPEARGTPQKGGLRRVQSRRESHRRVCLCVVSVVSGLGVATARQRCGTASWVTRS